VSRNPAADEAAFALARIEAAEAGMVPADLVIVVRATVTEENVVMVSWDSWWKPPTDYGPPRDLRNLENT
jgi:hypothetical protein